LRRITKDCRKVSDKKLTEMMRSSLRYVMIGTGPPLSAQIRFQSSA